MTNYYIIRFEDLSARKQLEILNDISQAIIDEKKEVEWIKIVGEDSIKPEIADPEAVYDYAMKIAEFACDSAWVEMEVKWNI